MRCARKLSIEQLKKTSTLVLQNTRLKNYQVIHILAFNSSLHPSRYMSHARVAALVMSDTNIIDISARLREERKQIRYTCRTYVHLLICCIRASSVLFVSKEYDRYFYCDTTMQMK